MSRSRGVAATDLVVGLVICTFVALLLLVRLPSAREESRELTCRQRLGKIGIAMALYEREQGRLPEITSLGEAEAGPGPLDRMLTVLGLADFDGLKDVEAPVPVPSGPVPTGARVVAGFVCPNDPNGRPSRFPAPVSYRANAGSHPDGEDGPFAPGQLVRLDEIQAHDGLAYTAAFSERLLGRGGQSMESASAYRVVPGRVGPGGCPPGGGWRADAGSSWLEAHWASTLYNHAATPGVGSDCVSGDGRTAVMRASSAHREGVHVLRCDGSVGLVRSRVDAKVWLALGGFRDASGADEGSDE